MLCPVCGIEMIVAEIDQVEIDYCPQCKGVWLDAGELDVLIEMAGAEPGPLSRAIEAGGKKVAGQKRRCPVCRRRLLEVEVEGQPPVVVDRCRFGHGIWLDDRELGALIRSAGGSTDTGALARFCGRALRSQLSVERGEKEDVGPNKGQ